jgi:anti-sigma-K factor RskA
MKISANPELSERLAAEYALGTLGGGARRRFEIQMRDDARLRTLAATWQERLVPLAESIPEAQPPDRLWQGLVRRIPALAHKRAAPAGWFSSLLVWRTTAITAALVAVVAIGLGRFAPETPAPPLVVTTVAAPSARYVATFADPKTGRAIALVYADASGNEVSFTVLDATLKIRDDQTLELWTAAPEGKGMIAAGLVPNGRGDAVQRFAVADATTLRGAQLLGLSLEPAGGSPAPTHVLGVAHWVRIEA